MPDPPVLVLKIRKLWVPSGTSPLNNPYFSGLVAQKRLKGTSTMFYFTAFDCRRRTLSDALTSRQVTMVATNASRLSTAAIVHCTKLEFNEGAANRAAKPIDALFAKAATSGWNSWTLFFEICMLKDPRLTAMEAAHSFALSVVPRNCELSLTTLWFTIKVRICLPYLFFLVVLLDELWHMARGERPILECRKQQI